MHGLRRTLQKRLERQPASAVTTSPSAGWTCASARPRTAVATLPSCRSLRRALQPRRVRVRLPSLLAWLRTAPQSTPSSISTSTSTRATFLQVVNHARRLRQDFSLGHPPCGAGGDPLSVGNVAASRGTRSCGPPECLRTGERELLWCWCIRNKRDRVVVLSSSPSSS